MSKAKFTKGEWEVSSCGLSVSVDGHQVARAHSGSNIPYTEPTKSNAHLIAAAPEMYCLLERLTSHSNCKKDIIHLLGEADSLLAKARGESC